MQRYFPLNYLPLNDQQILIKGMIRWLLSTILEMKYNPSWVTAGGIRRDTLHAGRSGTKTVHARFSSVGCFIFFVYSGTTDVARWGRGGVCPWKRVLRVSSEMR